MIGFVLVAGCFAVFAVFLFISQGGPVLASRGEAENRDAEETSTVARWPYFRTALVVRLLAIVAIRATSLSDFFAPDRIGYETLGRAIANNWRGDAYIPLDQLLWRFSGEINFYHYLNGASFFLGLGAWGILILNAIIGATVPRQIATLIRLVGGTPLAQRQGALFGAFLPSLIIWSSINIRDVWAMSAILFALNSALAARERLSATNLITFAISMALLGVLRGYMFVLVSIAFALSSIASLSINRIRAVTATIVMAGICFWLYNASGFGRSFVEDASFERLAIMREGMMAGAGSAYLEDANVSTPEGAARFLPLGLAYFWFAPFPWIIRGFRQALTLPEVLVIYWLVPSVIRGARRAVSFDFGRGSTVVAVILIVSFAYALVEGNFGTAYRHRAQILPMVLAFAAIGYVARRSRRAGTEQVFRANAVSP